MELIEIYIFLAALAIPGIAQLYVMATYGRFQKKENQKGLSGYEIARKMLDKNGLEDIDISETKGKLSDHYDPRKKAVFLSHDVYHKKTISSAAIAAHEVGHAIQDKQAYTFMRIRAAIFPFVSVGTKLAYGILIVGLIFSMLNLIWVAIALVGLGLLFQLITLPVEFNASTTAKSELQKLNLVDPTNLPGVASVLRAAALTYVAGVISSALEVIRLILIFSRR
ncbi:zinc metallopeptidase [Candidatus Saccharibacteria bacterium]|nr:zinc metallopeptidase [Candidatus Saccharibacteria bacterium]